jgi:hypothetical protein
MVREFKNPRRLPGAWPCSKSLRSLGFYSLFLFRADQISDSAACLASGLAGSLAFAASFKFNGVLQRRLIDCNDMSGHDVTSLNAFLH